MSNEQERLLIPRSLFFAITTGVSGYYLHKYLREGVMPYQSSSENTHYASGDSAYNNPKDAAWSTEIETANGRDSSDSLDRRTDRGGNQEEDEYALLHSTETDEGRHPGRPLSWGEDRNGTYGSGGRGAVPPYAEYRDSSASIAAGVDALSPGGYEEFRREAAAGPLGSMGMDRAPSHSGSGYSFSGGPERLN